MWSKEHRREYLATAGVVLSLFALAAIFVQPGNTQAASCADANAAMGPVGSCLRSFFVQIFGLPGTILIAITPLVWGLQVFGRMRAESNRYWFWFLFGLVLLLPIGIGLGEHRWGATPSLWSGLWGGFWSSYFDKWFHFGAWFMLALLVILLGAATLGRNLVKILLGARPATVDQAVAEEEKPKRKKKAKDGRARAGAG